jgi:V/A-type H+-transporting ATPase subunit D
VEQVTATRSELLARRARIRLATQGRDLLQEKRDQLMEEFRKVADVVLSGSGALDRAAAEGRRALALAEAFDGPEAVASAALAGPSQIPLEAKATSVMGVRIAEISYEPVGRPLAGRGYSLAGSSPRIDHAAERFEAELDLILELAASELRLRRLADEIGKTTRRVNALESIVIPRLASEVQMIQAALEERERQDRFRLKRIKARKGDRIEESR